MGFNSHSSHQIRTNNNLTQIKSGVCVYIQAIASINAILLQLGSNSLITHTCTRNSEIKSAFIGPMACKRIQGNFPLHHLLRWYFHPQITQGAAYQLRVSPPRRNPKRKSMVVYQVFISCILPRAKYLEANCDILVGIFQVNITPTNTWYNIKFSISRQHCPLLV